MALSAEEAKTAPLRVLIVARDDAIAGPLAEGLDGIGWRTITARGAHAGAVVLEDLPIEAAVVIESDPGEARHVAERLRASRAPAPLAVISVPAGMEGEDDGDFDLSLSRTCHPVQLALRLEHLMRTLAAEEEYELRRRTLATHGRAALLPTPEDGPLKVLTVGEPAPKFLALAHALRQRGAEVTGAFTAYTAFDYLHERAFDAAVLWGGGNQTEALSIAAGIRRNSRLYHLPALMYLQDARAIDLALAYRRGVTDVASADTPERETARRTVALAQGYRRERAIRQALDSARGAGLMDPATGLFTPELFAEHLGRLLERTAARRKPLSLAVLKMGDTPDIARARPGGWLDRALPQIGSMIARLVRSEDTATRLGPELFVIALPGADATTASRAANRISAVIGCTAFAAEPDQKPFVAEFEIAAVELAPGEPIAAAVTRARLARMSVP